MHAAASCTTRTFVLYQYGGRGLAQDAHTLSLAEQFVTPAAVLSELLHMGKQDNLQLFKTLKQSPTTFLITQVVVLGTEVKQDNGQHKRRPNWLRQHGLYQPSW